MAARNRDRSRRIASRLATLLTTTLCLVPLAASGQGTRDAQAGTPPSEADRFAVRKVLEVGEAPHQIAFTADGATAWIAVAGSDRLAEVDVATLTVEGFRDAPGTPLGVAVLGSGELLVSRFGAGGVIRLPMSDEGRRHVLSGGKGASLLVGPVGTGHYLVSVESEDRLRVLDPEAFEWVAAHPAGKRPFPPAVTPDGRRAFIPGYDDGTVTVTDLEAGESVATVEVGERPSGGTILPGGGLYAVAVRGEDRIALVDTESYRVVGEVSEGIGDEPFSVVVSPDGQRAFVNNTASHDVSVLSLGGALPEVTGRVPTGEIPIVMAVHPDGQTLWVSCEGSHELWVIDIPPAVSTGSERPTP